MELKIVKEGQTAILVIVAHKAKSFELKESLDEMKELAVAVGLQPLCAIQQKLKQIDSAFLIGLGKQEELKQKVCELKPHYIIFDHSLSGVQTRNLEKLLKIHVLDRTQLILEIFSQRAKSREGKLQVELAQLMDQMPRMVGAWLGSLSRQGGGRASRGPGEKALEIDRRQAQNRIGRIEKQLEKVKKNRSQRRYMRKKNKIPSFALLGYTNSGKSTLLNRLTKSSEPTKNQAFMTLDPKTRKLFLPDHTGAVITDTVGFIRRLPEQLISAFQATLEESAVADVILHVVDISHPKKAQHIQVVDALIERFNWSDKPIIYVFNKMDILTPEDRIISAYRENSICVSAKTGENIPALLSKMKTTIENLSITLELFFPKHREYEIFDLSRQAIILKKEENSTGTFCCVKIPSHQTSQWNKYLL